MNFAGGSGAGRHNADDCGFHGSDVSRNEPYAEAEVVELGVSVCCQCDVCASNLVCGTFHSSAWTFQGILGFY